MWLEASVLGGLTLAIVTGESQCSGNTARKCNSLSGKHQHQREILDSLHEKYVLQPWLFLLVSMEMADLSSYF